MSLIKRWSNKSVLLIYFILAIYLANVWIWAICKCFNGVLLWLKASVPDANFPIYIF